MLLRSTAASLRVFEVIGPIHPVDDFRILTNKMFYDYLINEHTSNTLADSTISEEDIPARRVLDAAFSGRQERG